MKFGFAVKDITPDMTYPVYLAGYAARGQKPAVGVHDPLSAKAAAFSSEGQRAVMVSIDTTFVPKTLTAAVRKRVAAVCADTAVLLSCTHTHSAPSTLPWSGLEPVERWMRQVEESVVQAAIEALANLQPGEMSCTVVQAPEVGKNRREGETITDPALSVLQVRDLRGALMGVIVNYACHCTVLDASNQLVSADYPGYLYQDMERAYPGVPVLFQNGCAGDVNIGYSADASALGETMSVRSFETAQEKARILFEKIAGILEERPFVPLEDVLCVKQKLLPLPVRGDLPTAEQAKAIDCEFTRRIAAQSDETVIRELTIKRMYNQLLTERMESVLQEDGQCRSAEFDLLQLGDVRILFVPGELFSKVGLAIKRTREGKPVVICGYANDYLGYFPTAEALSDGGYEAETSVFAPELEACIVSALEEWN